MGKWATYRRRGGSPPLILPLTILRVYYDTVDFSATWDVQFNRAVTILDAIGPDDGFDIPNCHGISSVELIAPDTVRTVWLDACAIGDAWNLTFQPNWLIPTFAIPQLGLTEAGVL